MLIIKGKKIIIKQTVLIVGGPAPQALHPGNPEDEPLIKPAENDASCSKRGHDEY